MSKINFNDDSDNSSFKPITLNLSLSSIGFIVFIIFLILKLCNPVFAASVSWFWVWFPLWIVPACSIALVLLLTIVILILGRS